MKHVPPVFKPEPGWEVIPDLAVIGGSRPFVTGKDSSRVMRLCYFRRKSDGALVGKIWFGSGAEGPPHHAHGGAIAGVFDEIMGAATWLAGHPILAARVTVDFRKPVPLGVEVLYEAWVESIEGRRVKARGRMLSSDGRVVFAEGNGIFVLIELDRLGEMKERVLEIIQRAGIPFQNK
jgi:hypothetical protein